MRGISCFHKVTELVLQLSLRRFLGNMSLSIYQRIIADAFDSKNWKYSCKNLSEEKSMFSINFTSDVYGKTSCKVTIFDDGVCDIAAVLPIVCNE